MKKLFTAVMIIAGLMSSQYVLATPGYFTAKNATVVRKAKNDTRSVVPATDITIANGSTDIIYAFVPDTSIDDVIYPLENDHIRHYTYYGDTPLVLEDRYHNAFFSQYVCRYAVINVYGQPGYYHVNVDSEYCD